jgi:hypothetical protein
MPKTYQEIMAALKPEETPIEVPEEIPEERPEFRDPPQPGSYRFRVPSALENCFDTLDVAQRDSEGKPIMVKDTAGNSVPSTYQRVQLVFRSPNALTIEQSPANKTNGEPFDTRISNAERPRFIGKNQTVKVSDLTYLLRAKAPQARPRTNQEFIAVSLQVLPNQTFGADVEWNGYCNPTKDAIFAFPDDKGGQVFEPAKEEGATENRKGCGKRIYSSKWPHDANGYAPRATCECGASIRPFAQLVRYKD